MFGLPDPDLGEVCVALVSPSSEGELDLEKVRSWANERLEKGNQIKEIREVNNIPVNNIGKKVRKEFQKVWSMNDKWRKTFPVFLSHCHQYQGDGAQ